ncbi:hypothetical protein N182_35070 [Sinorhizobium sp. GL2]|nr:hypothetical protein N182_35070 [Sinorhizobium sp. GL2]
MNRIGQPYFLKPAQDNADDRMWELDRFQSLSIE